MQAERPLVLAGGNVPLSEDGERTWRTNWPVHLAITATAALSIVMSPGLSTVVLASGWVLAYLLGHWTYIVLQLPGAGPAAVVLSSSFALALLEVSDAGIHLFAAFPLIWLFLPTSRRGVIATALFAAALVVVMLWGTEDPTAGEVLTVSAVGVGVGLFSIIMAAWIWRIETLGHQHRLLAEELRSTVADLEHTRSELATSEHRRGAEEERSRIAADIHDTLAQSFTSITMLTQAARQSAPQATALLGQIEEVSRDGLAEARGLIARSQPPLDLAASIERLSADLATRTGLSVTTDTGGWFAAPTRTEVVLLRTAQEALRNVERHAGATSVTVHLTRQGRRTLLTVADDGAGFDPSLPTAGYGLMGMRSRLETEGGQLQITTGRAAGTILEAMLPPEPADAAEPAEPAAPAEPWDPAAPSPGSRTEQNDAR